MAGTDCNGHRPSAFNKASWHSTARHGTDRGDAVPQILGELLRRGVDDGEHRAVALGEEEAGAVLAGDLHLVLLWVCRVVHKDSGGRPGRVYGYMGVQNGDWMAADGPRTSFSPTSICITSERRGTMRCSFSSLQSARVTFLTSPKSIR